MRRVLALAVMVAFLPTANAQDTAKADFSANAEYRARYFWTQNPRGNEDAQGTDSDIVQRFKAGLNYKANEKFSARATLIHDSTWGHGNTETVGNTSNAIGENLLTVNEVYANWMFSDDMSFRFGRQNFQIGDGYVISTNDWEQQPTSFEGAVGNYEAEFGRFQLFGFKYREIDAGTTASRDPEHNAYGLNFDLKTMPEVLKALNVHVIQDVANAVDTNTGNSVQSLNGQDVLRYGAMVGLGFGIVDFKAWYAAQTGKYKNTGGATVTEQDAKGMMYQAELGVNLENFMGSRIFGLYHMDSGDDNTADNDAGAYDPYFYERHANAGLMDLFQWGNLTYITLGWTLMPADNTKVGLLYHMFSRTESHQTNATSTVSYGDRWANLGAFATEDLAKDDLGDEIDLYAEHMYDGGLSTVVRLGYFMPGDVFKNPTPSADATDNILQVMIEGKLNF